MTENDLDQSSAQPTHILDQPPGVAAFETVSEHARATYLPDARRDPSMIGLCLSGGGFRASLFHLGALRRLNELGALSSVTHVTSVSGGSITAGHLATCIASRAIEWPSPGNVIADWEQRVARPFRAFTATNIRTGPILKRLLPWNWFRPSTQTDALAKVYETRLTGLRIVQLPDRPQFIFCATDVVFGVNWEFRKNRVGDYQAGYAEPPPPDWPLSRAIAASSCFPPVFDPMSVGLAPEQLRGGDARQETPATRDALVRTLSLVDGGLYDNMGLEPVWKRARVVLVSNGGALFTFGSSRNWIVRLLRYNTITGNQAGDLRKRWLISSFIRGDLQGTYWDIGSAPQRYARTTTERVAESGDERPEDNSRVVPPGYSLALAEQVIGPIRTDIDAFSPAEIAVLENHGYFLTNAAILKHARDLIGVHPIPPATAPWPEWMDEEKVRRALANSPRRTLLGRPYSTPS